MKKNYKYSKGITIVSLVVTIILLIILAGISIQALTNTGLFEVAGQSKRETKRAQVTEWLNLKLIEEQAANPTGTAEDIIESTRENVVEHQDELKTIGKEITVENTKTEEDGEQVDIYFYVQVDEDVYKVEMTGAKFIGEAGKFPPIIKLESITGTTNSIIVTVTTKRNEGGKIEFYIKKEGDSDYTLADTKTETEISYTYTGLEQNKKYSIKVVATAENEQTAEVLVDKTLGSVPDLTQGDITFTYSVDGQEIDKETWTNKSVKVTASTTITGYTLKTSTDGKTWSNETSQTFIENGKIYVVLYDGTNYGGSATGNVTNIDTTKPVVIEATATTNSISITATDEASGIVGYAVTESSTKPTASSFTAVTSTKNFSTTVTGKTQGTTYYVWVKDEAGNISESKSTITDTVISGTTSGTITFSTATWSGGKASTTISTNTSYIIQYQVNSTTGTWTTGTSVTGLVHGDKVYARLWDGTNGGAASAANNILDGTDPSASISLSATSVGTTKSITATVTHSDSQSGVNIANCKWVYNTTSSAIGTSASSYTGTFSSISQTITLSTTTAGTYYLHVLTTDLAGRTVETISNAVTVKAENSVSASTVTTHTVKEITYSWDELSSIAKMISNNSSITNNTAELNVKLNGVTNTLGVGDTATVDSKTVRILGFNHDTLTSSTAYGTKTATGKAGISFEYVDFLTSASMNSWKTNAEGWGACELRSTLNSTTYNGLSIKNNIKQVQKEFIPTYNNTSKSTSSDYLWLLSCGEIWDNGYNGGVTRGYAIATEGSQYKYYKSTLGSTIYKSGTLITRKPEPYDPSSWWLRSPDVCGDQYFCRVLGEGDCVDGMSTVSYGVAPGFSI